MLVGPLFFLIMMLIPESSSFTGSMKGVAATTCLMAYWWCTEAAPIPVTSLLPLVLFPFTGGLSFAETASSYADSNVFLFMGGFIIATAIEKWNLHRRIALYIIRLVGTKPDMLVLGFMVSTGFISMWISNTATAMMMLPIGIAVIIQMSNLQNKNEGNNAVSSNFGQALMLSIAYSATIGGTATLIGTPPNAICFRS